jgi:hypothetical protein
LERHSHRKRIRCTNQQIHAVPCLIAQKRPGADFHERQRLDMSSEPEGALPPERALRKVLAKLKHYLKDFEVDVASLLWKGIGNITIRNVCLRPEAFVEAASLGLTIKSGSIGLIDIEAPWSLLMERQVRVKVNGVSLSLETRSWDDSMAADLVPPDSAKSELLEADFVDRRQKLLTSEEERARMLSLLITALFSKVDLTITNVEVHLADAASKVACSGAGAGASCSKFLLKLNRMHLVAEDGSHQGISRQLSVQGLCISYAEEGAPGVDLLHTGAVATMHMRPAAAQPPMRPAAALAGSPRADESRDPLAAAAALLAVTIGVNDTRVTLSVAALRAVLDASSHLALVHTRRHALLQITTTQITTQMRHAPLTSAESSATSAGSMPEIEASSLAVSRPFRVPYFGHAKEWWRYVCGCTLAQVLVSFFLFPPLFF